MLDCGRDPRPVAVVAGAHGAIAVLVVAEAELTDGVESPRPERAVSLQGEGVPQSGCDRRPIVAVGGDARRAVGAGAQEEELTDYPPFR